MNAEDRAGGAAAHSRLSRTLRSVPLYVLICFGVALSFGLAALLDLWFGFSNVKLGEWIALAGVLAFALPALQLNSNQRQRADITALMDLYRKKRSETMTDHEREDLELDIARLEKKIDAARTGSLDWSATTEICMLLGYLAILTGSFGKLFFT